MQLLDDRLLLSASDLINFLECEHLTALDLERGARPARRRAEARRTPPSSSPRKGDEHEQRHLDATARAARRRRWSRSRPARRTTAWSRPPSRPRRRCRPGAPVIFQATFLRRRLARPRRLPRARRRRPSDLGDWSYEVADTKLARSVKPYFVLQLCFYSELVARIQGAEPERDARRARHRRARELRARRLRRLLPPHASATSPSRARRRARRHLSADPVEHCGLCRWADVCDARASADDHLSLVAGMRRDRRSSSSRPPGIATVAELARRRRRRPTDRGSARRPSSGCASRPACRSTSATTGEPQLRAARARARPDGRARVRAAARAVGGRHLLRHRGRPVLRGRARVPVGRHLPRGRRAERFQRVLGHDRAEEKRAFEEFIDFVIERRRALPRPARLPLRALRADRAEAADGPARHARGRGRRAAARATCSSTSTGSSSRRCGSPSRATRSRRSRRSTWPQREAAVTDGEDSILKFEQWLDTGDQALLDCDRATTTRRTASRPAAARLAARAPRRVRAREYGVEIPWRPVGEARRATPRPRQRDESRSRCQRRAARRACPTIRARRDCRRAASRWLLRSCSTTTAARTSRRGGRSSSRFEKTPRSELTERLRGDRRPASPAGEPRSLPPPKRSLDLHARVPGPGAQDRRRALRRSVHRAADPATGELDPFSAAAFNVERVLDDEGIIEIRRGNAQERRAAPARADPARPLRRPTLQQRGAARARARTCIDRGLDGRRSIPSRARRSCAASCRASTARRRTASRCRPAPHDLDAHDRDRARPRRQLPVRPGPARLGQDLHRRAADPQPARAGKRVGVAANSHKAIHNLLARGRERTPPSAASRSAACRSARARDSSFESKLDEPADRDTRTSNGDFPTPSGVDLMAGTAWLWCREEMRESRRLPGHRRGRPGLARRRARDGDRRRAT